MKTLITGKKGFIGQWLTKTIPNNTGLDSNDCDIRNYTKLKKIINKEQPTNIIHLAAISNPKTCQDKPTLAWQVNVNGTKNILKIASEQNIKTIVMSSAQVYQNGENLTEKSKLKNNGNTYIQTKLAVEELAREHNAITIRPFNQEGPGRPTEYYTSKVILSALNNKTIDLWNPKEKREYMDVRDGVNAIKTINEQGKKGETYNLSNNKGYTKLEYIQIVEQTLNKKVHYNVTRNEEKTLVGNNEKIRKLGWRQQHTIQDTIKDQTNNLKKEK